jgi:hypothetical protein
MPYPRIWADYLHAMTTPSPIHFYRVTFIAVERIKALIDMPLEDKPRVPYAGFDLRDIQDYNLENLEDYNLSGQGDGAGVVDMIGATDVSTTISVWLLLLFELFRAPSRLVGDDFRRRRITMLGMRVGGVGGRPLSAALTPVTETGTETGAGTGDEQKTTIENFLEMVAELLRLSHKLKEGSYLLCIKVIAAMNWQVPAKDLVGSTEVPPPLPLTRLRPFI